jgi:hypothetical protein
LATQQDSRGIAAAAAAGFVLDRAQAVPALLGRHEDFLIIAGLAGTARDIAALTRDSAHSYTLAGAMGAAATMGLGLALARPDKRVLVITGDGDMLMGIGGLATIGVKQPRNLAIVVLDNQHYGETGMQPSHTQSGVDLIGIARGCGFSTCFEVTDEAGLRDLGQRLTPLFDRDTLDPDAFGRLLEHPYRTTLPRQRIGRDQAADAAAGHQKRRRTTILSRHIHSLGPALLANNSRRKA